ncbi:MAG: methyltransferase domain-containing protein [Ignavibacteriae bacterium]|nr:methyltransferase domain-containing protein [Ignavibacteriota bacterium]
MSSCCTTPPTTEGTNKFFSRHSKRYEKQFRKKGLAKEQQLLLNGIRKESVADQQVLDIGCGVGALHLTLLQEGAKQSVGVDLAEGMVEKARGFAAKMGVADKVNYIVGDFVQVSKTVPDADITMLDKVVCCYENLDLLLRESTSHTKRVYALTHPKNNFIMELAFKTHILFTKLVRVKFRPYWHDWTQMRSRIAEMGFQLVHEQATFSWQVLVYKRV